MDILEVKIMKKIIIMADFYHPRPLANGICVHQVALGLRKKGYEVHIICFNNFNSINQENYEGVIVHYVKMRLFNRLRAYGEENIKSTSGKFFYTISKYINNFKRLVLIPLYPLTSPLFLLRFYRLANKLHLKYKFDMVLSVFNPLEAVIVGSMLKKKDPKIKFGLYFLDTLTNGSKRRFLPKYLTEKKGWQWERRVYEQADVIYNMKSHEKHHQKERYSKYKGKMEITDIPLFINFNLNELQVKPSYDIRDIHWVYAGALDLNRRSPRYLCELFTYINKNSDNTLHFYSRGNSEQLIEDYKKQQSGNKIIRHGYVEREEAISSILSADILVSIGNSGSQLVPSKIFEYISTGKKIIHFYKQNDDSCIIYYQKYPNALLVNENDDFSENAKKVNDFLQKPYELVSLESIKDTYLKNSPEYIANRINSVILR